MHDVLISIKPEYAFSILRGEKRVEFRKRPLSQAVNRVFIYITAPYKKIYGYFTIAEQVSDKPENIWNEFQKIGGIDKISFDSYYLGKETANALVIHEIFAFSKPITGEQLINPFIVPQSFIYIPEIDILSFPISQIVH